VIWFTLSYRNTPPPLLHRAVDGSSTDISLLPRLLHWNRGKRTAAELALSSAKRSPPGLAGMLREPDEHAWSRATPHTRRCVANEFVSVRGGGCLVRIRFPSITNDPGFERSGVATPGRRSSALAVPDEAPATATSAPLNS
jgi:hypothetical protein